MDIFDYDFIKYVNSGKCYVVLGAGPSIEEGLPSWEQLALKGIDLLDRADTHRSQAEKRLRARDYPAVFSVLKAGLGVDRYENFVRQSLSQSSTRGGSIYKTISRWPFPVYLTTNLEHRLREHLRAGGAPFVSKSNSEGDVLALDITARDVIFHIHGVIDDADTWVLTREDYEYYSGHPDKEYWRDKLFSALNMVPFVILGYGLQDPDFNEQLQRAKRLSNPQRYIYLFAPDMDRHMQEDLFYQYNIKVIGYHNADGTHSGLRHKLKMYDPFILPRGSENHTMKYVDATVVEAASSMFIFNSMRLQDDSSVLIERAYAAVILRAIPSGNITIALSDLRSSVKTSLGLANHVDDAAFVAALDWLYSAGYIHDPSNDEHFTRTAAGEKALNEAQAVSSLTQDRFQADCALRIQSMGFQGDNAGSSRILEVLRAGLQDSFRTRGLDIAKSVYHDDSIDLSDATDIIATINKHGSTLVSEAERQVFAELVLNVLLEPSQPVREYLGLLSQCYFTYHALGLDPECSRQRLKNAQSKVWVVDSSVLLPLIAKGCQNHIHAVHLLEKMHENGLRVVTTELLTEEVLEHAFWAFNEFEKVGSTDILTMSQ